MKKIFFVLALLALTFSPPIVSQADAAPVRHHHGLALKHHRKSLKKHTAKRLARRHRKRA